MICPTPSTPSKMPEGPLPMKELREFVADYKRKFEGGIIDISKMRRLRHKGRDSYQAAQDCELQMLQAMAKAFGAISEFGETATPTSAKVETSNNSKHITDKSFFKLSRDGLSPDDFDAEKLALAVDVSKWAYATFPPPEEYSGKQLHNFDNYLPSYLPRHLLEHVVHMTLIKWAFDTSQGQAEEVPRQEDMYIDKNPKNDILNNLVQWEGNARFDYWMSFRVTHSRLERERDSSAHAGCAFRFAENHGALQVPVF